MIIVLDGFTKNAKYRSKENMMAIMWAGNAKIMGPIQAAVEKRLNFCENRLSTVAGHGLWRPCSRYDDTFCAAK